jgi:NAD(P)-dependent dehydrogenase (short-subunit alcohol dehydrogenase family)
MEMNLKGKRVLVTGGSKGIGRACADAFAAEGCEVLIASRTPPPARNAKAVDMSKHGAAEELAGWAGDLDILVNNAGAIPGGDLLKVEEETWRKAWDLKLFGYINLSRQVYGRMKKRKSGVIINIIGSAGEKMDAAYIAGSTANAGLMAFTRALGGASHADGPVVDQSRPISTDRLRRLPAAPRLCPGTQRANGSCSPKCPFGRPKVEEIAAAVVFLASERSSYTSGCILTIDGGLSARSGR